MVLANFEVNFEEINKFLIFTWIWLPHRCLRQILLTEIDWNYLFYWTRLYFISFHSCSLDSTYQIVFKISRNDSYLKSITILAPSEDHYVNSGDLEKRDEWKIRRERWLVPSPTFFQSTEGAEITRGHASLSLLLTCKSPLTPPTCLEVAGWLVC